MYTVLCVLHENLRAFSALVLHNMAPAQRRRLAGAHGLVRLLLSLSGLGASGLEVGDA